MDPAMNMTTRMVFKNRRNTRTWKLGKYVSASVRGKILHH